MAHPTTNNRRNNSETNDEGAGPVQDSAAIITVGELHRAVEGGGQWLRGFFYLDCEESPPEVGDDPPSLLNSISFAADNPPPSASFLSIEAGQRRFRVGCDAASSTTLHDAVVQRIAGGRKGEENDEKGNGKAGEFAIVEPLSGASILPCERAATIARITERLRILDAAAGVGDPFASPTFREAKGDAIESATAVAPPTPTQRLLNPPPPSSRDFFFGGFSPDNDGGWGGGEDAAWSAIHTHISAPMTAFSYDGSGGMGSSAILQGLAGSSGSETPISWEVESDSSDDEINEESLTPSSTSPLEEKPLSGDHPTPVSTRLAVSTPDHPRKGSDTTKKGSSSSASASASVSSSPLRFRLPPKFDEWPESEPRDPIHEFEPLRDGEATNQTWRLSPAASAERPPEGAKLRERLLAAADVAPTQAIRNETRQKRPRSPLASAESPPLKESANDPRGSPPAMALQTSPTLVNRAARDPPRTTTPISFTPGDFPASSIGSSEFFFHADPSSFSRSPVGFCYPVEVRATPRDASAAAFTPNARGFEDPAEGGGGGGGHRAPVIVVTQQPMPDYVYRSDDSIGEENPAEEEDNAESSLTWGEVP
ncbi:unnamed protein product [Phytomonas sp. EM1]|nr:unnamed protein product [Phytomonas sp. EM1]|eukprot:CCW61629.1 unnamed protein product [Phytomonas sp. isolate EM1]